MDPRDDHDIGGHNEHRIDVLTRWLEHDGPAPEWSSYSDRLWWDDLRVVLEKRKDLGMTFIEKGRLFLGPLNTDCVGELLDTELVHANSELIQFLVEQARPSQNKEKFAKTISRCVSEVVDHYLWCGKDKTSEGLKTLEWLRDYHDLATRRDLTCMDYGRRRQVKDQGLAQVIAKSLIWLCENDDYEVPSSLLQAACSDLLDLVRQWGVDIDAGNPDPEQVNDPTQSPFASACKYCETRNSAWGGPQAMVQGCLDAGVRWEDVHALAGPVARAVIYAHPAVKRQKLSEITGPVNQTRPKTRL